jgi:hypothetical protein
MLEASSSYTVRELNLLMKCWEGLPGIDLFDFIDFNEDSSYSRSFVRN